MQHPQSVAFRRWSMNAGCATDHVFQWFWSPRPSQCRVLRGLVKATSMMSCTWEGFMHAGSPQNLFCDNPWMQDARSIALHHAFLIHVLRFVRIRECYVTKASHFTMHFNANQSLSRVWYGQNLWMREAFPQKCNRSIMLHSEGNLDCWEPTLIAETSIWLLKG